MKTRSIVYLFTCVTMLAIATSSWAGGALAGQERPVLLFEVQDIRLRHNRQIAPYVPSDIKEVPGQVGVHTCNDRGEYAHDPISGCLNYSSASTNTSWRIRYGQAGAIIAIFKLNTRNVNGKKMQVPIRYVQFDAGHVNTVIYASDEASKYAAANGLGETQIATEAPTQAPPQQQPAPVQQAKVNCSGLNLVQRLACEAENNPDLGVAIGVGIKGLGK